MKASSFLGVILVSLPMTAFTASPRIVCSSTDGQIAVEATKLDWTSPYKRLDTDLMVVKRKGKANISATVHAMTLNSNIIVLNEGRYNGSELVRLTLGKMNSNGVYPRAKLMLEQSPYLGPDDRVTKPVSEKHDLNCTVSEDLGVENICNEDDESAYNERLKTSVKVWDVDGVEQALACGADVDTINEKGCSSLMTVIDIFGKECKDLDGLPGQNDSFKFRKAEYLFKMLLNEGASSDFSDLKGETVAHKAVSFDIVGIIPALKDAEANLDSQDAQGMTPIMRAVLNYNIRAVQALLDAQVDLKRKNILGLTAYDMSVHLPENIRNLVNPNNAQLSGLVIKGEENGTCSPTSLKSKMGKPTNFILKANSKDMFIMSSPDLDLEIMANPGATASKTITINKMGTFKFECGVHGGRQTSGTITITH